jgi:hypothetical protein
MSNEIHNGYRNYPTWVIAFFIKENKNYNAIIKQIAKETPDIQDFANKLQEMFNLRLDEEMDRISENENLIMSEIILAFTRTQQGCVSYYDIAEKIKQEIAYDQGSN